MKYWRWKTAHCAKPMERKESLISRISGKHPASSKQSTKSYERISLQRDATEGMTRYCGFMANTKEKSS